MILDLVKREEQVLTLNADIHRRVERELGRPVLAISSVTGQGLGTLVGSIAQRLRDTAAAAS